VDKRRPGRIDPGRHIDNLSTAVLVLDETLAVGYANPAAEQLLGVSAQQLRGRQPGVVVPGLSLLTPLLERAAAGDHDLARRELAVDLDPVGARRINVDCAVTMVDTPDRGREIILELVAADWRLRIKREAGLLAQLSITRGMMRQLAHEIRNPLGGIRGAAQLLGRQLPSGELAEYTTLIMREADRLASLAGGFLGPSGEPSFRRLNVHEIVEHIRRLMIAEAEESVTIVRDYDPSLPELNMDRDQIIQAMMNLARNALQASGPAGRIVFRTRALMNRTIADRVHRVVASVEIEDDGPGVPDALRDTLFYPLVTGRAEGTGLGLATAQDLVSRHGGLIEFDSRPGRTVFSMLFPIEEEVPESHDPPSP
jgi:two-component system nitrogen regulation sensor histidine kinase GlnL